MESESLTKICSLFISWTKALIWKGLSLFAMTVDKILWTMWNWDCTSMLCIPKKKLLNVLSVVRTMFNLTLPETNPVIVWNMTLSHWDRIAEIKVYILQGCTWGSEVSKATSESLKSGYFCAHMSRGAPEVLWEPRRWCSSQKTPHKTSRI